MVKQNDTINLSTLNLDELTGVVSMYPWFALARKELCARMCAKGKDAWEESKYAEQAMYMGSRSVIRNLVETGSKTETPLSEVLNDYFHKAEKTKPQKQIYVIGGDYFTQDQYASVRKEEDNIFTSFAGKAVNNSSQTSYQEGDLSDFCTESLAKVYLEQGYPDQAKEIYSKLSLRYPEKSVYFAALIDKIDKQI